MLPDTTPEPEPITKVRQLTTKIEARLLDLNLAHEGGEHREAVGHFQSLCQLIQQLAVAMVLPSAPQKSTLNHQLN